MNTRFSALRGCFKGVRGPVCRGGFTQDRDAPPMIGELLPTGLLRVAIGAFHAPS
jgi:hypothetical protein